MTAAAAAAELLLVFVCDGDEEAENGCNGDDYSKHVRAAPRKNERVREGAVKQESFV